MDCKETIYLVGYTGFVGSNLYNRYKFNKIANSKDIKNMYGDCPDVLVYAGVTGTKWYANIHDKADKAIIENAIFNIKEINPRKLILISTVDVFDNFEGRNEDYVNDPAKLHIYGKHRLELEEWVKNNILDYHIIRLPAIFGENIKKNFIYDLTNYIPFTLSENMYRDANSEHYKLFGCYLKDYYIYDSEGFYHFNSNISSEMKKEIFKKFRAMKHNALMFTNCNSEYQFYNLEKLWDHIQIIVKKNISIINLVTEPLSAKDVCWYVDNYRFNSFSANEIHYKLTTKYTDIFTNTNSSVYLYDKAYMLEDIKKYILNRRRMFY